MLKKLPLLSALLAAGALFFTSQSQAQVNYTQDFEGDVYVYSVDGFDLDFDGFGCDVTSLYTNIWYNSPVANELISTSIGISNGLPASFSYDYKILSYDDLTAYPNDPDWGNFKWEYATAPTGPWTELETVSAANHLVSEDCATRTVDVTSLPVGNIFLRLTATVNDATEIDALIFYDNLTFVQEASPVCTEAPVASATVGGTDCINGEALLTLDQFYTDQGISYQWQSSTDGTVFVDIDGADQAEYTATATTVPTWYQAVITCTGSGLSTTSTPVELVGTRLCYCEPSFTNAVEPITNVAFAGVDNLTSEVVNGTPAYEDFTESVDAAQVVAGTSYQISVQGNTDGDFENYITVFFDFNVDGDFDDEGEAFEIPDAIVDSDGTDGQTVSTSITIPATATLGTTRFRVFKRYGDYPLEACGAYGYGQVEDYALVISEDTNSQAGFNKANFKYSPNPVLNVLNLQYASNIESVQVVNMLGQTVLTKNNIAATDAKVDMSALQAGTYLVKVADAQGGAITVKVVKQ